MRLIDADALKKSLVDWLNWYSGSEAVKGIVRDIVEHIDNSPTIEAEPMRYGENVTYTHPSDMFLCSCCGFSCEITELRHDEDDTENPDAYEYDCKFCPDCGAKMDGGATHAAD